MSARDDLIEMKRQLTPGDILEADLKSAFTLKPLALKKFKGRQARLKGMLTQWEPYRKQIETYTAKKIKESRELPDKISRLRKIVKDECAHPIDSLVVHKTHIKAITAQDVPCTEYYVKCSLCGKRSQTTSKSHSHYGE